MHVGVGGFGDGGSPFGGREFLHSDSDFDREADVTELFRSIDNRFDVTGFAYICDREFDVTGFAYTSVRSFIDNIGRPGGRHWPSASTRIALGTS